MTVGSLLNRYFRYNDRFGIFIWPVAGFLRAPAAGLPNPRTHVKLVAVFGE